MVVDDDTVTTTMISKRLEDKGFRVLVLNDSTKCLAALEATPCDVVLLDIIMPKIDGVEVLKKIRKQYSHIELPVIMLTLLDGPEEVVVALQEGANDYITKPINLCVLEARIQTQLMILELMQQSVQKSEIEALNSMITTYNHEINNPLTIALTKSHAVLRNQKNNPDLVSLEKALQRISGIVRKISNITGVPIVKKRYAGNSEMVCIDGGASNMNLSGKRILVVDDELEVRELMVELLEGLDFEVLEASCGNDAKKIVLSQELDLIISDQKMFNGDGLELLDFVRRENKLNTPFVLVTGFSDGDQALDSGANAMIGKPFDCETFTKTINEVLSKNSDGKELQKRVS